MGYTPLRNADFFLEIPIEDTAQKRLTALKEAIEKTRLLKEKEKQEEEKRKKFISGLLGG